MATETSSLPKSAPKKIRYGLLILVAIIGVGALGFIVGDKKPWLSQRDRHLLAKAQMYELANIDDEVASAMRAGDYRFVGIFGEGIFAPGVPPFHKVTLDRKSLRTIEDTGDVIESGAHKTYIEAATRYAERYNMRLGHVLETQRKGATR